MKIPNENKKKWNSKVPKKFDVVSVCRNCHNQMCVKTKWTETKLTLMKRLYACVNDVLNLKVVKKNTSKSVVLNPSWETLV